MPKPKPITYQFVTKINKLSSTRKNNRWITKVGGGGLKWICALFHVLGDVPAAVFKFSVGTVHTVLITL